MILLSLLGPLAVLPLVAASDPIDRTRGVPRSKLHLYEPQAGSFRCLDGSASIPFERVNDDYCDCADGSDEPGTSACPNGTFFCRNAGHIPVHLPSSRVNDGVCEEACCDGSDEWLGLVRCPDTCREQAREHAAAEAAREATRSSGWRVKEGWMKRAHQLRVEIEDRLRRDEAQLEAFRINLRDREASVEKLQAEGAPGDDTERWEDNAVEVAILKYKGAITVLREQVAGQQRRIGELETILADLAGSYNPNFQDMAVKGAVTSYNELGPLPEAGITTAALGDLLESTVDTSCKSAPVPVQAETATTRMWQIVRSKLVDYGVLQREDLSSTGGHAESKQLVNARASAEKLREEVHGLERDIAALRDDLAQDMGERDVLRAVKGQCFSALISEYTYEVCLLDTLHQKSASSSTLVGNFDRVDENGSLVYSRGARCWNGPERSGRVDLECGKANELISVREAQKCEYVFRVRSPLACSAPKKAAGVVKEEL